MIDTILDALGPIFVCGIVMAAGVIAIGLIALLSGITVTIARDLFE